MAQRTLVFYVDPCKISTFYFLTSTISTLPTRCSSLVNPAVLVYMQSGKRDSQDKLKYIDE